MVVTHTQFCLNLFLNIVYRCQYKHTPVNKYSFVLMDYKYCFGKILLIKRQDGMCVRVYLDKNTELH